jgi:large subunit ribosomal protein L1
MSKNKKMFQPGKGGKQMRAVRKLVDKEKEYSLDSAIEFLQANKFVKFDESLEVAINLGVDTKHSDQAVRGVVSMPAGTGKTIRVAVFVKEDRVEEAKKAGADMAGSDDLLQQIQGGKLDFDICIATPDMMGVVGRVARVLGPKGLMPNPKLGTVTVNIEKAINDAKSGQVEFRAEKAGIVHAGVGKVSFKRPDLISNVKTLFEAINKAKPAASKGAYLKSASICSTMGPSLKLDLSTVQ